MTAIRDIITIIAVSLTLFGCNSNHVYYEYKPVDLDGWNKDSAVAFAYNVSDTTSLYDVIIHVRHNENYRYQNMWLFINTNEQNDTIEFYLADERGRWLGNGHKSLIDMPILFEENKQYADTGAYVLSIRHGMRNDELAGISDIGVEIIRHGKK